MKIVIAGAGEIGFHLAKLLSYEAQDIYIIDNDAEKLKYAENHLDVITKKGNATSINDLKELNIEKSDILLALTNNQDTNFTVCVLGKALGVQKTIARIENPEFLRSKDIDFSNLGIDFMVSPEALAAEEVRLLLNQSSFNETIPFENGLFNIIGTTLGYKSPIIDLNVEQTREKFYNVDFIILAIKREGESQVIIPRGNTIFKPNDEVYFSVPSHSIDDLYSIVGKKQYDIKNVMILGGTSVGEKAARRLANDGFKVKLLEEDKKIATKLAEKLQKTLVINADARNLEILEEEGIKEMDAFVAVTKNSETNIISCLVAKSKGVHKTVALVENMGYINISQTVGIDTFINKKLVAASNIFRHIRNGEILALANLRNIDAEALEFEVQPNDKVTKKMIKNLGFPREAVFGGIVRDGKPIMSFGDVKIQEGDKVIVFCSIEVIQEVEKFFS